MKMMKTAALVYTLCVMIIALSFFLTRRSTPPAAVQQAETVQSVQKAAQDSSSGGPIQASFLLFPDLDESAITAISVHTPDRSFQFHADGLGDVSVNGQRADSEIYMTLVSQISELPVDVSTAFNPEGAQLLLTLTVFSGESQHTACFYEDSDTGEIARIVAGSADAPEYRQTSGWRVGTLMITCEGTRIQNERGNETPSDI